MLALGPSIDKTNSLVDDPSRRGVYNNMLISPINDGSRLDQLLQEHSFMKRFLVEIR